MRVVAVCVSLWLALVSVDCRLVAARVNNHTPSIILNLPPGQDHGAVLEKQAPGAFVAHLAAYDDDDGLEGEVTCRISDNRNFELEHLYYSEYRLVTRRKLSHDAAPLYSVIITCSDSGSPKLSTAQNLRIDVLPVTEA